VDLSQPPPVQRDGRVAILTLNRPEVLNALSAQLRRALHETILALDADSGIGAIVLTGAGPRTFTAGLDLKEAATRKSHEEIPEENPVRAIDRCRKPIIVAVNGLCITGGMEIMLARDVVYAASTARFADTHVVVGLMPGWGISQRMDRQIGTQRGKEISLSGNFIGAERAFEIGLINRVLAPERLMPAALQLAHDFPDGNSHVVQAYKKAIDDGFAMTLEDGLQLERERAIAHFATLQPGEIGANRVAASNRDRGRSVTDTTN
jgi:enoyl-CoA hydratase